MKSMAAMPSKRELLVTLWQLYSKQKGLEEDSGGDVLGKIDTMRGWFRAVLDSTSSPDLLETLFPYKAEGGGCSVCGDKGWFFDDAARIPRKGPDGKTVVVRAPGMVVCVCPKGTEKQKNKFRKETERKGREAF